MTSRPASDDPAADALLGARPVAAEEAYCAVVSAAPLSSTPRGCHAQVLHDGLHWVLVAVSDGAALTALEAALPRGVPAAMGLVRVGPTGARRSVVDARQAFVLAIQRRSLVRFGEEWVAATVVAAGPALDEAGATAVRIAHQYPHLADAVRAFADHGLSVVGAARALF